MNILEQTTTPGHYYAIAYWLATFLLSIPFKKRQTGWRLVTLQLFFLCSLVTLMVLTDGVSTIFFVPCMIAAISLIFFLLLSTCQISFYQACYYTARAFIIGEFAASFEWQLYYYSVLQKPALGHLIPNILFFVVCHSIIFGLIYLAEKNIPSDNDSIPITRREVLAVTIIALVVFIMSNLSYASKNTPFSSHFTNEIYIIRTIIDFAGMALMFAYHIMLGEIQARHNVANLKNILNMQYNNYQMLDQSVKLVNQKYHDLKHQIDIIRNATQTDKHSYLDQIESEIKNYEAQNKTGNKILDTILTAKSLLCIDQQIQLTCVADGTILDFIEDMDISALFGNALDNAIESVRKIPEADKRLIHLAVIKEKNFVRIRLENYYEDEIIFINGLPQTTKDNKDYHGFGLKSIHDTVEKYAGSTTINTHNNWFELRILIPIPSN